MATNATSIAEREPAAATSSRAQQATPGPQQQRLGVFVGKWTTRGRTKATPSAPAADIVGTDTYEWLEGGFFLVHRVNVRIGAQHVKGLEIIAYDASNEIYRTHAFDSQGHYATYQATVHDGAWTFMGKLERAAVVPSDAGDAMTIRWERSTDGLSWLPWMDMTLTKVT
jgi:hypothetical protein